MNRSVSHRLALLAALGALSASARAEVTFTQVFTVNKAIADLGELADVQTVSFGGGVISEVTVGLRIDNVSAASPAWSGDYYAGLGHGIGYATLLNRIGMADTNDPYDIGAGHGGVNITLSDTASANVRDAAYDSNSDAPPALTGAWRPDGRNPATPGTPATLASFNNLSPNGAWELLIADDSPGGTGRLVSWSLSFRITPDAAPIRLADSGSTLTFATPQTLANNIVNQGLIVAPGEPGQTTTLTGQITGAGNFQGNFTFLGSYSPGNSPAAITFTGDTVFGPAHVLTMEIGGTAPGTGYDTLAITGDFTRGGILNVVFINGFIPAPTDFFRFFTAASFGGAFSQINLPAGVTATGRLDDDSGFTLSAIPEPAATAALLGIGALGLLALRRPRRRALRNAPCP